MDGSCALLSTSASFGFREKIHGRLRIARRSPTRFHRRTSGATPPRGLLGGGVDPAAVRIWRVKPTPRELVATKSFSREESRLPKYIPHSVVTCSARRRN